MAEISAIFRWAYKILRIYSRNSYFRAIILGPLLVDWDIFDVFHLKCHYDENGIFSIEAILKHKEVACMRRKMLFTIFKYIQDIFKFLKYAN